MNDAAERVRFDLSNGSVRAGGGERVVLLPSAALEELGKTAGIDVACALSRAMGVALGKAIARRLGSSDSVRGASLEAVAQGLATELAVAGWGAVSLERWGRAMVLVVEHAPVQEQKYVASILEGALHEVTGRQVRCLSLSGPDGKDQGDTVVRILVAGDHAVARARDLLAGGTAWGDVLVRLQAGGGAA